MKQKRKGAKGSIKKAVRDLGLCHTWPVQYHCNVRIWEQAAQGFVFGLPRSCCSFESLPRPLTHVCVPCYDHLRVHVVVSLFRNSLRSPAGRKLSNGTPFGSIRIHSGDAARVNGCPRSGGNAVREDTQNHSHEHDCCNLWSDWSERWFF